VHGQDGGSAKPKKEEPKKDGAGGGKPKKRDGGKDAAPAKEKERKKTAEEVLLEALGAAWRKGDAKALAARFPAKRKVSLRLPGAEAGDYRAEQARSLLEDYFAARTFTKVELKSVKETAGTFALEYRRTAAGKTVQAELLLVLGTESEERVLVSARESP